MVLRGSRIAFLGAEHLSEAALLEAVRTLEETGARIDLIGSRSREIPLLRHDAKGVTRRISVEATRKLHQITPAEYQAVALPATLLQDGRLHADAAVRDFILAMQAAGRLVIWLPLPEREGALPGSPRRFSMKRLLADSWQNWNAINAPRLGAALAYYTLLSLAPLLILSVTITSLAFRREIIQSGLIYQVEHLLGSSVANTVRAVLQHAQSTTGGIAGAVGILMLLVGASGVFLELRDSLDTVWGVKPRYGTGLLSLIRERAFAFLMILGTGVVLLLFFVLSAILDTPARFLLGFFSTDTWIAQSFTLGLSLVIMTFVFALIYRVLPDISLRWGDVWIGALVTAALFSVGKVLIAIYLANAGIGSPYAAAGSIVLFLTWVYYSAQIFLFGAEFTHVYTLRHGSRSAP